MDDGERTATGVCLSLSSEGCLVEAVRTARVNSHGMSTVRCHNVSLKSVRRSNNCKWTHMLSNQIRQPNCHFFEVLCRSQA